MHTQQTSIIVPIISANSLPDSSSPHSMWPCLTRTNFFKWSDCKFSLAASELSASHSLRWPYMRHLQVPSSNAIGSENGRLWFIVMAWSLFTIRHWLSCSSGGLSYLYLSISEMDCILYWQLGPTTTKTTKKSPTTLFVCQVWSSKLHVHRYGDFNFRRVPEDQICSTIDRRHHQADYDIVQS